MVRLETLGRISRLTLHSALWFQFVGLGVVFTVMYVGGYTYRAVFLCGVFSACGLISLFLHYGVDAVRYKQMYLDLDRGYL